MKVNVSRKKGPLYLQIKEYLEGSNFTRCLSYWRQIFLLNPNWKMNFNVSKITVRNAIKELVQEGYLEKKVVKERK